MHELFFCFAFQKLVAWKLWKVAQWWAEWPLDKRYGFNPSCRYFFLFFLKYEIIASTISKAQIRVTDRPCWLHCGRSLSSLVKKGWSFRVQVPIHAILNSHLVEVEEQVGEPDGGHQVVEDVAEAESDFQAETQTRVIGITGHFGNLLNKIIKFLKNDQTFIH